MGLFTQSVDVDVEVSVSEFYGGMSDSDKNMMVALLAKDVSAELMNILEYVDSDDKPKFYKELAYHVGNSDSEHLEPLIEELQYWSKK